jgi:hypothetical protein
MAARDNDYQLYCIYRLLIGFQKCTNLKCAYCDLDFLRARVAAYIDRHPDTITPEQLHFAWKYLHPNVGTPALDEYHARKRQGIVFAQDYLDAFY